MNLDQKTIGELKGYRFLVPSYQRGYRWTKPEVIALLEDVLRFSNDEDKKYCIQPLILKKLEEGSFEVVDGQQRLTTIYIFMKIAEQEFRSVNPLFDLKYETRPKSEEFLKNLSCDDYFDDSNIDFYHMSLAYKAMNDWLESRENKITTIQKLYTKFIEKVFFLWYELPENSNPIEVFTKVNLGKIPLTNAELIKALILSKDNFEVKDKSTDNEKEIKKQQLGISIAWDKIEQGLQDDSFWYFLNDSEEIQPRIDLLFILLAEEYSEKYNINVDRRQQYFSFLVFLEVFKQENSRKHEVAREIWERIEQLYDEFRDWYNDLDKYHIIGYLISTGKNIQEIFKLTRGKRKSQVKKALLDETKINYSQDELCRIYYNSYNDKKKIRKLLLLFNIATLVCKSEKQYRFPFDIYKKSNWDIEHIHATADGSEEADDGLWNLTLLDCKTNRSYQDDTFAEKRRIIIERESNGLFVPVCTKNIFLKVYTSEVKQMQIWDENDKLDYILAISEILDKFFKLNEEIV